MNCQRCGSNRVLELGAKCSDCCNYSLDGEEHDGYAPQINNICGGDYIETKICLECGQTQGTFPVTIQE